MVPNSLLVARARATSWNLYLIQLLQLSRQKGCFAVAAAVVEQASWHYSVLDWVKLPKVEPWTKAQKADWLSSLVVRVQLLLALLSLLPAQVCLQREELPRSDS